MSEFDQTFEPKVVIGHCDLISWFTDFALYLDTHLTFGILICFFQIVVVFDQTFDPILVIGHCDVISWFIDIDFAIYLDTKLIYEHASFG